MTAVDDAQEVDGLLIADAAGFFSGGLDPWIDVPNAPRGSLYLHTDGRTFKKIGLGQSLDQWLQIDTPAESTIAVRLVADTAGTTITTAGNVFDLAPGGYQSNESRLRQNPLNPNEIEALADMTLFVIAQANINSPTFGNNAVEVLGNLRVNGADIPGGISDASVFNDSSIPGGVHDDTIHTFGMVPVVAGDVIDWLLTKLETSGGNTTVTTEVQGSLVAFAVGGLKGDKGEQGEGPSIFGSRFQVVEASDVSTTISTQFQPKLALVTPVLPAGKYRVELSYFWNHDATTSDFEGLFQHNGLELWLHKQEVKDSAGQFDSTGSSQKMEFSKPKYLNLSAGIHTFDISYRTDLFGAESSIWDTAIAIHRVT